MELTRELISLSFSLYFFLFFSLSFTLTLFFSLSFTLTLSFSLSMFLFLTNSLLLEGPGMPGNRTGEGVRNLELQREHFHHHENINFRNKQFTFRVSYTLGSTEK